MTKEKNKKKEKQNKKEQEQQEKIEDLTESLKRLQAEFDNFRKRTEKEKAIYRNSCKADIIKNLLPILDNFELALKNKEGKEFKKDVELIYAQLYQTLEDEALEKIECKNKEFDPYCHEALLQEECDKKTGTITQELQKGYRFKDKIIRHSKVKVAK